MQKTYPRTTPAPFGASENSNVIPAPQIEEALRESVRQNAAHIRHEPENTSQVVTDVNSLVQQVAGVSLDQLDDVIVDLRNLRDAFLKYAESTWVGQHQRGDILGDELAKVIGVDLAA